MEGGDQGRQDKAYMLRVPWPLLRDGATGQGGKGSQCKGFYVTGAMAPAEGGGHRGGGGKTKVVSALMPCRRNGLCTATGGRTGSQDKGAKWG